LTAPEEEDIKSMSHAYTMPRATRDERIIKKLLFTLSEKIAVRMRRRNFWGSEIRVYARFETQDKSHRASAGAGRSRRMRDFTNDGKIIFKQAWAIFQSLNIRLPIRMANVAVAGLALNVVDEPLFLRYKKLQQALFVRDRINRKYGDFTLRPATLLDDSIWASDTVGFGRMKEIM